MTRVIENSLHRPTPGDPHRFVTRLSDELRCAGFEPPTQLMTGFSHGPLFATLKSRVGSVKVEALGYLRALRGRRLHLTLFAFSEVSGLRPLQKSKVTAMER